MTIWSINLLHDNWERLVLRSLHAANRLQFVTGSSNRVTYAVIFSSIRRTVKFLLLRDSYIVSLSGHNYMHEHASFSNSILYVDWFQLHFSKCQRLCVSCPRIPINTIGIRRLWPCVIVAVETGLITVVVPPGAAGLDGTRSSWPCVVVLVVSTELSSKCGCRQRIACMYTVTPMIIVFKIL